MVKSLFLSEKFIFYNLVGVISFVLLYPKFPLIEVPGTYVAVRIEDVLILILGILWLGVNFKNVLKILKKPIFQSFLLFWGIGFLSLISALFITASVVPHIGLLHWLRRIEFMSLFIMAATTIKSEAQVKTFLKVLFFVNILIILYGFGQVFLQLPVISTTNREFSKGLILTLSPEARVNSTFAGHYDLAIYLSIILVFLGSLFFYYKEFYQKILIFFSGVLSFILLGMTAARASFMATFLALAVTFWLSGKKLLIGGLVLLAVVTLIAVPSLRHRLVATVTVNIIGGGGPKYTPDQEKINSFTPFDQVDPASRSAFLEAATASATMAAQESSLSADIAPGEPINTEELGVYRSANIRTQVEWPRALRAFYKNPILGTGYSSNTIATDNDFLRSLAEVGVLGTLSLTLIFFMLIRKFLKRLNSENRFEKMFLSAALGSIIVVLATGIFIDVLEASKVATLFWAVLGISYAITKEYDV